LSTAPTDEVGKTNLVVAPAKLSSQVCADWSQALRPVAESEGSIVAAARWDGSNFSGNFIIRAADPA